ncbi:retrovirus-related pol polyprotein from transposon TNT 1-94 [Tanacetum coccineum]
MQEELNQFIANDVWELVPQPKNMTIIGTKWVFRNKLDENGIVSQNKARLVAQGYNQQEGIDYDETYVPVARLESIRILLAYACALDFKLFQMDVKSAFLDDFINEKVYVVQPLGFIDFEKPDHVYKLKKALYGLKKAPKAWYDRLKPFLINHEYKMGMVDNTLFTKKKISNLIIVQIYVDDIIFGSTCQDMCDEFAKIMHDEFEMSMMGELNFFLGLQIKQMEDGIFFNQSKYIKEMLKKFGLEDSKPMKTPMSSDTKLTKDEECESVDSTKYQGMIGSLLYLTVSRPDIMFSVCLCAHFQEAPKTSHLEAVTRIFRYIKGTTHLGLWYPKGTGIETIVYADSDHAGDYVDQKSTSGICMFVGCCLTSWFSKKQTDLAISTTEAKYVSIRKACQQALWMKQALIDYDNFAQILGVPCEGACVFTDRWRLDEVAYGISLDGPYQTNPPSIEDIILSIRIDREGQVRRIRHEEEINVLEYQVLTREIKPTLKPLEEIIQENVFYLVGNRDHVPACLCFMLYYAVHSENSSFAYYMAKRMEWVTKQARLLLPYGMLLTRLFTFIMYEYPELKNESYVLFDHVMTPLAAQLERKPRRDHDMRRGRHSTSSSTFDQTSSFHLNDDDDYGNDEGTSRASTPSPIRYVNSLTDQVPQVFKTHLTLNLTLNHFTPAKPKSSTVKSNYEMSNVVELGQSKRVTEGLVDFCFLINIFWNLILQTHAFPLQSFSSTLNHVLLLFSLSSSSSSTKLYHEFYKCFFFKPSKKIKLTIIPPRQLFVNISSDEDVTTTPLPTTTSSSLTPPNAPSKTTSTNETSSSQENTSSSFHSKLQISPPSSHEPNFPYHLNPLLENILDVPPRPLNPQPLQSHPSLDTALSLSPITPLDHIHDTPSPPSPPQPQPPIMGHPLFYKYHDYHGSTCICCFHNHNLHLNLRDEMNIMFAHLEYHITIAFLTHFPPPPLTPFK